MYNINNSSLNSSSQYEIAEFGRYMRKYAIANWIMMGSGVLAYIIAMIVVLAFMSSFSYDTIYLGGEATLLQVSSLVGMSIAYIFIYVAILGVGIFVLVRYFQYLSRLKSAAVASGNDNLSKAYKLELTSLILTISLPIVLSILSLIIFLPLMNSLMSSTDFETMYYSLMGTVVIFILLVFAAAITLVVLQIIAAIRIDDWGKECVAMYGPRMQQVQEGTNLIKWGRICAIIPVANSVATILYLVGLTKAGKAIEEAFSQPLSTSASGAPQFQSYQVPQTFVERPLGSDATTMYQPPHQKHCPYCGATLINESVTFCSMCGKKI